MLPRDGRPPQRSPDARSPALDVADARIAQLQRVPLFAHCGAKELAFIVTQVEELDFPAGKELCREGHSGGDFFIILSGSAVVTRAGIEINHLGKDDFFGEIALLDHGPRTATVVTTSPTHCLVLGPRQFHSVLQQRAEIATAVLAAVAARLRSTGGAPAD